MVTPVRAGAVAAACDATGVTRVQVHGAEAPVLDEHVDRGLRLSDGLGAHRSRVPPLQREVLQEQDARLVGRVVQRPAGDVAVHAKRVESEVDSRLQEALIRGARAALPQGYHSIGLYACCSRYGLVSLIS